MFIETCSTGNLRCAVPEMPQETAGWGSGVLVRAGGGVLAVLAEQLKC